jgi:hypothetical protein
MQLVCDTEPIVIIRDESNDWDRPYVIKNACYKLLPECSSDIQGVARWGDLSVTYIDR